MCMYKYIYMQYINMFARINLCSYSCLANVYVCLCLLICTCVCFIDRWFVFLFSSMHERHFYSDTGTCELKHLYTVARVCVDILLCLRQSISVPLWTCYLEPRQPIHYQEQGIMYARRINENRQATLTDDNSRIWNKPPMKYICIRQQPPVFRTNNSRDKLLE